MASFIIGIDIGTGGVRTGIYRLDGEPVCYKSYAIPLHTPGQGWVEQDPLEHWQGVCVTVQAALKASGIPAEKIIGMGIDATSCTVLALDEAFRPMRPAMMWCDVRAGAQADALQALWHPVLERHANKSVNAEWLLCKALWLKEHEPEVYYRAQYFCECLDWINYKLTSVYAGSINVATIRWYYDSRSGGLPEDLYASVGLEGLLDKLPKDFLSPGAKIGTVTKRAAKETGLPVGLPVAMGGADAYVALLALNVTSPGRMAIITGSSNVLLGVTHDELDCPGVNGPFPDAMLPGRFYYEGGQASGGSVADWFVTRLHKTGRQSAGEAFKELDARARRVAIGSDGLIFMEHFQGNRTPYSDSLIRGGMYGLSLSHGPEHIFRALMEAVCYGSESVIRLLQAHGARPSSLVMCGGALRSDIWPQMYADVIGVPIEIPKCHEAPTLASAMLGGIAGRAFSSIEDGIASMVKMVDVVEPDLKSHEAYRFYVDRYIELYPLIAHWAHQITRHEVGKQGDR